jgi:hypothetical protein
MSQFYTAREACARPRGFRRIDKVWPKAARSAKRPAASLSGSFMLWRVSGQADESAKTLLVFGRATFSSPFHEISFAVER